MKIERRRHSDGDAGSFDGHDLRHVLVFEQTVNLAAHLKKKVRIKPLVQKTPDFEYMSGADLSFRYDLFFKCFHCYLRVEEKYTFIIHFPRVFVNKNRAGTKGFLHIYPALSGYLSGRKPRVV